MFVPTLIIACARLDVSSALRFSSASRLFISTFSFSTSIWDFLCINKRQALKVNIHYVTDLQLLLYILGGHSSKIWLEILVISLNYLGILANYSLYNFTVTLINYPGVAKEKLKLDDAINQYFKS